MAANAEVQGGPLVQRCSSNAGLLPRWRMTQHLSLSLSLYIYIYIYMYISNYTYIYIYIHTCAYVHIHNLPPNTTSTSRVRQVSP